MSHSFVFLDAKACVNGGFMLKFAFGKHGLFPCFSGCAFLTEFRQGLVALFLGHVDGGVFLV
jgi:hypothetical protein